MYKFYAVGWQPQAQNVGQLDNFRQAHFNSGFDEYIAALQFPGTQESQNATVIEKFKTAITGLENTEANGNNTEVPFYRTITDNLAIEKARCDKVTEQLSQELNPVKDIEKIRLYIATAKENDSEYRFYIKALRTANLTTRFILTALDGIINITDTEGKGKALPYVICYAEKIEKDTVVQYVFNVQDYEAIFGLNESKINSAKSNCDKFFSDYGREPEYKVSGSYTVKVSNEEKEKITNIIESKRKIANALAKYNNEASDYTWEAVKEANSLSERFMQTPFTFDEDKKEILLTAESFEAWVSVITNTKN